MSSEYSVRIKGHFWYPGDYKDKYDIIVNSEDKDFVFFMDKKVKQAIEDYRKK